MTWTLNATGEIAPSKEKKLASELKKLLTEYGATASQLAGENVNGPVHDESHPGNPADSGPQTDPDLHFEGSLSPDADKQAGEAGGQEGDQEAGQDEQAGEQDEQK